MMPGLPSDTPTVHRLNALPFHFDNIFALEIPEFFVKNPCLFVKLSEREKGGRRVGSRGVEGDMNLKL
jgi:hypothetical protein